MNYAALTTASRLIRYLVSACITGVVVYFAWRNSGIWQALFIIESGVLALIGWVIGANAIQAWIDRRYNREISHAERALSDLGRAITGVRDSKTLAEIVSQQLATFLHVEPIRVFVERGNCYMEPGIDQNTGAFFLKSSPVVRQLQLLGSPAKLDFADPQSWVHGLPEHESALLLNLHARVLVPVTADRRFMGIVVSGPKRWDMQFSRADLQFLTAAASQIGLALENVRLIDNIRAEIAARERLNRELEIAREVQQHLFPQSLPKVKGLDVAGYCRPASGVGGDYYDFLHLETGRLGIAIGDVSGKGIAAALLMASLRASLRGQSIAPDGSAISGMIGRVNRLVYEASAENRYATFFYAEFDPATYRLRYVNAGHNAPVLIAENGEITRLEEGGTVLGLFPNAGYSEQDVRLSPGDLLVAFTDGITEALDPNEQEYGETRLLASLRSRQPRSAADLISDLLARVDAFTSETPQHDDMTLVVLRVC